ncbi:hypothetical protein [Candidatus Albibeggiatoa sp. nov. NOAA]|uniref:hypothetical protein n=1 Tax=Candidatus Albibeggiatoa sp. nov. NOAA TaxID=3162724 RepID=UPI0032FC8751|nr:hypothetical protein [Thiotrichaceae bacterium]
MNYLIDAHFEQAHPELRIINIDSNTVILEFDSETLNYLIEKGSIYPPDFLEVCDTQHIVKELFLIACSQTLHIEHITDACLHCGQCQQEPSFDLSQLSSQQDTQTMMA